MDRSGDVVGTSYSAADHFSDALKFPMANFPSLLTEADLKTFRIKYQIHRSWDIYPAIANDCIYQTPESEDGHRCVGISENAFKCGFRLPMLPLLKKLLKQTGIALGQLDPNGFTYINVFQHRCLMAGVSPRPALFWNHHDFKKNAKSNGFYTIGRKTGRPNWCETNSSNKGTHERWFYLGGHSIHKFSTWREVDPSIITTPLLVGKDLEDFEKLSKVQEPNRILLSTSREKEWLFTLWGSDSSLPVSPRHFLRYSTVSFISVNCFDTCSLVQCLLGPKP